MCIEKSAAPMFLQRHLMRTIALRETSILLSTCYLASNIRFYNQSMCGHGLFSIGYNCTAHSNRYPALVHVEQRHVIQHLHIFRMANGQLAAKRHTLTCIALGIQKRQDHELRLRASLQL
ncbi:unnamed protein product [Fusarium graminearum]|nr:unnamed protein product [Fusarium graminearum]